MRVRIPKPVNRALDAASRHPRVVTGGVAGAALAWPVGLYWASPYAAVVTAVVLAVYVAGAWVAAREARLRETIRQYAYDLAAEQRENERLRAGDASAPTAQLRSIGGGGEDT